MLELIAERDLSRISISDVTKQADVNRSTFYEHYTDLDDLAAAACTALFDEFVTAAPVRSGEPAHYGARALASLAKLFAHVAEHAHLYRALLGPDGSARVINHLLERITTGAHRRRGPRHADDVATPFDDPAAAFAAGAILAVVVDWLRRGCPGTPEQMSAEISPHLITAMSADAGGPLLVRRSST